MMDLKFDAKEIADLGRAFGRISGDVKAKAFARAMRRMRDMAKTRVVRQTAARTDLKQSIVRAVTYAKFNAGSSTIEVVEDSGWIGLYKIGATQTGTGVTVKGRGNIEHAFIAKLKSGHAGVFMRERGTRMPSNPKKEKIKELFGPNPAHDVTNNPDEYLEMLSELIEEQLMPRVLHEIERLLPR